MPVSESQANVGEGEVVEVPMEDIESDGDAGFSSEDENQPLGDKPPPQPEADDIDPAYIGGHGQFPESPLHSPQASDGSKTELEHTPQAKDGPTSPECLVIGDTPEGAEMSEEQVSKEERIKELQRKINFTKKQFNSTSPGGSFILNTS